MNTESAVRMMSEYFSEQRHVEHTKKVLREAEAILASTGAESPPGAFVEEVVRLAAVFHDIGIPDALRKHGSAAGPYQEQEGAALAPQFLLQLNARPDVAERVRYIVGHHHTRSAVDGLDFRIVWDADMLVNLLEGNVTPKSPPDDFVTENFETEEGARRARSLLGKREE